MTSLKTLFFLVFIFQINTHFSQSSESKSEITIKDEKGNIIETRNINELGNLSNNEEGYCIIKWKYDKHSNIVMQSYFDMNGKRAPGFINVSIWKYKYDKNNNKIYQAHYDTNENLMADNIGVSIWKYRYNKQNKMTFQGHYDTNNKLLKANKDIKYSKWFWKYKANGDLIKSKQVNR